MFPYRPLGHGEAGWSRVPDATTRPAGHETTYSHAAAIATAATAATGASPLAAAPSGVVRGPALRLTKDRVTREIVIDLR